MRVSSIASLFVIFFQRLPTKVCLSTPVNDCFNVLSILRCFKSSNLFKREICFLMLFEERLNFIILNVTCSATESRDGKRQIISFILLRLAKGIGLISKLRTSFRHFSPSLSTVNFGKFSTFSKF